MKDAFIRALEYNNADEVKKIPKGDLHNHMTRGGNKRYIEEWTGISIPRCPKFKNLGEMNKWNAQYIKPLFQEKIGYEKRIEAAFVQAKLDDNGIRVTISSDDMIIFDQSVSEEFLNLYNSGLFNAFELNEIRENGLTEFIV